MYITKEQFKDACEKSKNPLGGNDGFMGVIYNASDKMIEVWVQVDTSEFEYIYILNYTDGSTYYKGSR